MALHDIVSYAVICRVCARHGMQIHIQTCTCADQYIYILVPTYLNIKSSVQIDMMGAKYCVRMQINPKITIVRNK